MIEYNDTQYNEDKRYSFKNHTGNVLTGRGDMAGIVIACSSFSQEIPDTEVFPAGMKGTTFVGCNLDNCLIPPGNTIVNCSSKRFAVQNDGYDWEIDESNQPVRRLDEVVFLKQGIDPPDPADIPPEKVDKTIPTKPDFQLVTVRIPKDKAATFDQFLAAEAIVKDGG